MNQINVLGIDLNSYSLKELLVLTDKYLDEGPLKTILYIDAKLLMLAGQNDEFKTYLSKCDLPIIADEGILKALPKTNEARVDDIREEKYTKILIKKLIYGHKKIQLLADNEENLASLEESLTNYRSDLKIVSKISMDSLEYSTERMLNLVNDVVPDVVISKMEPLKQASLMEESRAMMNSRLWIGIPENVVILKENEPFITKVWNKLFHRSFEKEVKRYETLKKEDEKE